MGEESGKDTPDLPPDVLRRARAGDKQAMQRLIVAVTPMLRGYARAKLGSALRARMDESDLVQSTLLEGSRDFRNFSGSTISQFRAWIRGILRRNLLDDVKAQVGAKKRTVHVERVLDNDAGNATDRRLLGVPASHLTSPSRKVARRHEVVRLLKIMDELAEVQRRAIDLWLTGHSTREIAAALDRSELAAASLLKRALEYIRRRAVEEP